MSATSPSRRLAVLIDADNVSAEWASRIFSICAHLGEPTTRRAYGRLAGPDLGGWQQAMLDYGITPFLQLPLALQKNGTDIALAVDAMELLLLKSADSFCIVSSDRDFSRLATKLRDNGKHVYGIGDERVNAPARKAYSQFLDLEPSPNDARLDLICRLYEELAQGDTRVLMSKLGLALKSAPRDFEYGSLSKLLAEFDHFVKEGIYVSLRTSSSAMNGR